MAPTTRIVSLGTKLALAVVVVLAIVSTALFVELTGRERQGLVRAKQRSAEMVADLFAASLSAPLDFGDADAVATELADLESNADITCALVWQGTAVGPIGQLERGGCERIPIPSTENAGARVLEDSVIASREVFGRSGTEVGRTAIVFTLAPENAAFAASRARIFWLSFALAAVTALVLIVLARTLIVAPLAELGTAARRIGAGALETRVEIASNDEIGELARAFNAMGERLADRERRLAAATQSLRDLFDHMRQAILAFGPDGRVQGAVSRSAAGVFGDADLEGVAIRGLLYPGAVEHDVDAQAFDEWMAMAFRVSLDQWDQLAALAPHEVVLERPTGGPLPLELEFLPIVKGNADGAIERIMLLATDVSERRALQAAVHTQEEEHARRMAAMRRLIAGGGQIFVAFMDAARERLARCNEIVGGDPRTLSIAEIDELFRHVHTIKGEARAFELHELETETAKLEEELDELRAAARGGGFATTGSVHGLLVDRLTRTRGAIDKGGDVFVAASPIGRAALDQITVQRSDVQALLELVGTRHDTIARIATGLASRPFGESAATLFEMTPSWGEEVGKRARLEVTGREVRVPPALARVLAAVLTHLVRNAVVHGIEIPALRERARKGPVGVVGVEAREGPRGPVITIQDDGAGLDLARLKERAVTLGVEGDGPELVFTPGLSTLDTASLLAGRGVGLGAVRADLAGAGYAIEVSTERGKFTRFVLRPAPEARA